MQKPNMHCQYSLIRTEVATNASWTVPTPNLENKNKVVSWEMEVAIELNRTLAKTMNRNIAIRSCFESILGKLKLPWCTHRSLAWIVAAWNRDSANSIRFVCWDIEYFWNIRWMIFLSVGSTRLDSWSCFSLIPAVPTLSVLYSALFWLTVAKDRRWWFWQHGRLLLLWVILPPVSPIAFRVDRNVCIGAAKRRGKRREALAAKLMLKLVECDFWKSILWTKQTVAWACGAWQWEIELNPQWILLMQKWME